MERLSIPLGFLMVFMVSTSMGFNYTCHEAERNALFKFKHGFLNEFQRFNVFSPIGSWMGVDCCSWKGVRCDDVTGNIVKLDLKAGWSNNFSDPQAYEVNPALLELKHLKYLDLSGIKFFGCRFPEFIGSMSELRYLDLSNTYFHGKVPHQLGNLTKLVFLDLSFACLYCKMEKNNLGWVSKLENLQYLNLNLGSMNLEHALDSLNICSKLPSLRFLSLVECGLSNSRLLTRNSTTPTTLEHLDLSFNQLSGSFPHFIQNLSSIRFLDLSYNNFNSSLPSWLGNNIDLYYLSLGHNYFNEKFLPLIQNLSSLTNLDLSSNQFSSSIVDGGFMNTIGNLCSLTHLDLSHNEIEQEVSQSSLNFSRCGRHALESMFIQNNHLSGHFPTSENMLSLRVLDLSHNKFEFIPTSFGKLSSLKSAILSYNHLKVVSQVNLKNLSSLRTFDISSNPLILELSSEWQPPFQLDHLHIQNCNLNTLFPKWILTQKRISELDLSNNAIFGPLTEDIGNAMPFLQSLHLANNQINGSIPRSLCKIKSLQVLDLQKNKFSGIIPECWTYSQIVSMVLSSNTLSGPIPNSMVQNENLQVLSLSNNSLQGMLPLFMSSSLMVLDVSDNNFVGEIPPWNGSYFSVLQIIILRKNNFKGVIPLQLCSIESLQIVDLAINNLGGNIPKCFGHFERMGYTQELSSSSDMSVAFTPEYNSNDWSAIQVIKGETLEYTTILQMLVNMDLSCNNLVGAIPTSITSLILLRGLNLSYNHLNSTIPRRLGNMQSLESLDLSHNNLSGSIPESISSIYSLSKMNLSFNNLQGQIPTGSQLRTLDDPSSMYMGNPGLCGDPLPTCFSDNVAPPPTSTVNEHEEENKHEKMSFYLVIMLGFAIGFWGVIGTLIVKRTWRQTYF